MRINQLFVCACCGTRNSEEAFIFEGPWAYCDKCHAALFVACATCGEVVAADAVDSNGNCINCQSTWEWDSISKEWDEVY